MTIETKIVSTPHGDITLYTLTNASGAQVVLSNVGAGLVAMRVPDREGHIDDVVLGYADPADYFYDGPCAGKVPGRYANRIARGKFSIDGKDYQLNINNGPNALHGGPEGFQNKIWTSGVTERGVIFALESPDGDEHYPGNLRITAEYEWTDRNELRLDLRAVTDQATVVNLTNHTYWNLGGDGTGTALDHELQLACSRYLPTDDTLIPTGELAPVAGTPMDFTKPKTLRRDIKQDFPALRYGKGYDNCWAIDGWNGDGTLRLAAVLSHKASGRMLEISTTQPAAQVYTGNWLDGSPQGKTGNEYHDYDAVAIECQGMPDAPNHPNFPSQALRPGEVYHHTIVFALKVE